MIQSNRIQSVNLNKIMIESDVKKKKGIAYDGLAININMNHY